MLRVVRCLPSAAALSSASKAHRAGVWRASGEETAGCTAEVRSGAGYGDLSCCSAVRYDDQAGLPGDDIAQVSRIEADAPDFSLGRKARNGVFTPQGKVFPHRLWPMKRVLVSKDDYVHGVTRCGSGARIIWPSAKYSMTIIAAPQPGQTKVGWTTPASAAGGSACATCSSSRARAR